MDDKSDQRLARAKKDFAYFVQTYFPHQVGLKIDTHALPCKDGLSSPAKLKDKSYFRNFVYKELANLSKVQNNILIEAYRGGAKTTLITRLFSLWQLLSGAKSYAIIISSTLDIASESSDTLRVELEDNAKLINDFKIVIGSIWRSDEFIFSTQSGLKKFKFFGAGKKIRGTNFLGRRPDLVICDDIENDENVESVTQRAKLYAWFKKAVLKLVSRYEAEHNIIVVGTRLHHDGLLARIKAMSSFSSFNFPLVRTFPLNLDEINAQNIDKADFKSMTLDDDSLNKKSILAEYFDDKDSFYSEYQNEPLSRDNAIFAGFGTFEVMPVCEAYYIGIDPAMGKTRGDYFAVALIGKNAKNYYLKAWGYKLKPELVIEKIYSLYIELLKFSRPIKIAIETIAFQEFFKDRLRDSFAERGLNISVAELKNSVAKELRLDSFAPYITDKSVLVCHDSHLLIEELETYPKAPHDDLLDASEMAFRIASSAAVADYRAINRLIKKNKEREILSIKGKYI